MDPLAATPEARSAHTGTSGTGPGRIRPQPWKESLQSIWREMPGLVSDRVDLLTLELKRAGRALAQIVGLLIAAAILAVTAWIALWAGLAVGLIELGLHWSLSLLLVLVLNAAIAAVALGRLRRLLPLLALPATRRHLTPGRITEPTTPPDAPPPAPTTTAPTATAPTTAAPTTTAPTTTAPTTHGPAAVSTAAPSAASAAAADVSAGQPR
jgi:hypothetical protein